jgi:hypothetical protein
MDDDRPPLLELPAAALNSTQCRVSRLQAVNDRFQSMGITGRANRECSFSPKLAELRPISSGRLRVENDPSSS